jgi:hypothetical protein
MHYLPRVPTPQVDIRKATTNFHKTMKLGGGGFSTIYRCMLLASATITCHRPIVTGMHPLREIYKLVDNFYETIDGVTKIITCSSNA